jgi:hypothetical protein
MLWKESKSLSTLGKWNFSQALIIDFVSILAIIDFLYVLLNVHRQKLIDKSLVNELAQQYLKITKLMKKS